MKRVMTFWAVAAIILLNSVLMCAPALSVASADRILMGSIVAPDRSKVESFSVLFRGEKKETDGSGFFTFVKKDDKEAFESLSLKQKMMQAKQQEGAAMPDDVAVSVSPLISSVGRSDKFYILITKDLAPVVSGTNDISGFRQLSGAPHLFFSCIAQNSNAEDVEILIKPTSIEKRNFLYDPSKTIVILMNPNRVKKLEYAPFKLDSQFIQLPRIILQSEDEIFERKQSKESVSQDPVLSSKKENLVRQSVKSNMYGLDLAPFFETPDSVELSKRIGRNQYVEIRL